MQTGAGVLACACGAGCTARTTARRSPATASSAAMQCSARSSPKACALVAANRLPPGPRTQQPERRVAVQRSDALCVLTCVLSVQAPYQAGSVNDVLISDFTLTLHSYFSPL